MTVSTFKEIVKSSVGILNSKPVSELDYGCPNSLTEIERIGNTLVLSRHVPEVHGEKDRMYYTIHDGVTCGYYSGDDKTNHLVNYKLDTLRGIRVGADVKDAFENSSYIKMSFNPVETVSRGAHVERWYPLINLKVNNMKHETLLSLSKDNLSAKKGLHVLSKLLMESFANTVVGESSFDKPFEIFVEFETFLKKLPVGHPGLVAI